MGGKKTATGYIRKLAETEIKVKAKETIDCGEFSSSGEQKSLKGKIMSGLIPNSASKGNAEGVLCCLMQ